MAGYTRSLLARGRPGGAFARSPLRPAAAAAGFSPADVAGLQLWLDASDIAGADGDAVATWADKSGNGRNATQATGTKQPLLKKAANGINGKNVVRFDGTDDELRTGAFTVNQPDTIFVVARSLSTVGGVSHIHLNGIVSRQQTWENAGTLNIYAGQVLTNGSLLMNPHVISVLFNGGASKAWIDGAVGINTANAGGQALSGGVMIGTDGSASWMNGLIAEILIYTGALSSADHNSVGNYLATKYGLTWTTIP